MTTFHHIKAGDTVVRILGGVLPMPLEVTALTPAHHPSSRRDVRCAIDRATPVRVITLHLMQLDQRDRALILAAVAGLVTGALLSFLVGVALLVWWDGTPGAGVSMLILGAGWGTAGAYIFGRFRHWERSTEREEHDEGSDEQHA
jgi:hypothetical protein